MTRIGAELGVGPVPAGRRPPLPPAHIASPSDMPDRFDPDTPFWLPDWEQSARLMGWCWLIVIGSVALLASMVWAVFQYRLLAINMGVALIKVGAFAVAALISTAVWLRKHGAALRTEPYCIHCGYSLEGLADNQTCPECGRRFRRSVVEEYKRDPHWFIERYRSRGQVVGVGAALEAGRVPSGFSDGTS